MPEFIMRHYLTIMTFAPFLGAIAILFLKDKRSIQIGAVIAAGIPLLMAVPLWWTFNQELPAVQFVYSTSWIPSLNIFYKVGIDGISILMVLLTVLLSFLCIFTSFTITKQVKLYFFMFLLLETGMLGA